ncbi:sugar phosphate nucleotidyltransferase [Micromonospora sp. NPDC049662]|uniref:sugar phosphate nucleotidyltransferase n=1 Tax=Micromonospora sp. NPDC049662 TaxID=3155397 RepID=UPI0034488417
MMDESPTPSEQHGRGARLKLQKASADGGPELSPARPPQVRPSHAVILAGGLGTRLRPYTLDSPKPLVALDEYTILEVILRQLRASGVSRVSLSVAYLSRMIEEVVGDGRRFGLALDYYVDPYPLGTAGPLSMVRDWSEPALVMNADVLTLLNFDELYEAHLSSGAEMTVAVHVTESSISHGIVDIAGGAVVDLWEKPRVELDVCAGIYVISPSAQAAVPPGVRFDMTELVRMLIADGRSVGAHRFRDDWYDIGTHTGLVRARQSFVEKRSAYLRDAASPASV